MEEVTKWKARELEGRRTQRGKIFIEDGYGRKQQKGTDTRTGKEKVRENGR